MDIKAIIFDLDGTLLNSIEDLADSMNKVLEKYNFPIHDIHDYEMFIGNGILNLVKNALPESYRNEKSCMKYFYEMFAVYEQNCTNKTVPYDGINDLLNNLTTRNIKIAILSNKAEKLTKKATKELLFDHRFDFVEGMTIEEHKKPNPTKALNISNNMGIGPKEIMFVGDSGIDMETATNAGMLGVGVLWGFRSKDELISAGAKHIISNPQELLLLL